MKWPDQKQLQSDFFKGTDSFGAFFYLENDLNYTKNQTPTKYCRPLR